jgi:NADPH2:quinone reductase
VRAVQVSEFGGPEVLKVVELPKPVPADGQLLVKVDRAGINYADTHQAENSYLAQQRLPFVPGGEIVGHTEDGRRVVALSTGGGYAEYALTYPHLAFDVPEGVSDAAALALIVQGTTAWHLLRTSTHMQAGESVVVISAAGGVGTLAVQLAKLWGAGRVIGTASTDGKRSLAVDLGADVAIDADPVDTLTERLIEANGGKRVDIVLEMTGGGVFDASLDALDSFGRIAAYGAASRTTGSPVAPNKLMAHSKSVVGFWLQDCFRRPGMMTDAMNELFGLVATNKLKPLLGGDYALTDAAKAHIDIRSRKTVGKLVLDPSR